MWIKLLFYEFKISTFNNNNKNTENQNIYSIIKKQNKNNHLVVTGVGLDKFVLFDDFE